MIFAGILATSLYNFFFLHAPCPRQFNRAAGISCRIGGIKYCAGSLVCDGIFTRNRRCGACDSTRAVCVGNRDYPVCMEMQQRVLPGRQSCIMTGDFKRNRQSVHADLPATVSDELRDSDGAGTGQQFPDRSLWQLLRRQ